MKSLLTITSNTSQIESLNRRILFLWNYLFGCYFKRGLKQNRIDQSCQWESAWIDVILTIHSIITVWWIIICIQWKDHNTTKAHLFNIIGFARNTAFIFIWDPFVDRIHVWWTCFCVIYFGCQIVIPIEPAYIRISDKTYQKEDSFNLKMY